MTNKSDIIRRALMNYLTPSERAWVQQQNAAGQFQGQSLRVAEEPGEGAIQQQQQMKPVSYKEALKKKPKAK